MNKDARVNYLRENLLTTKQATEFLKISKSYLLKLVKEDLLEPAFESPQGVLFFKDAILRYKVYKDKNSSLHYKHQPVAILENNYFDSMEFKKALEHLNKIERIHIYSESLDAALDGCYGSHPNEWLIGLEGAEAVRSPRLVVVDQLGEKVWSFCGAGTGMREGERLLKWISKEYDLPIIPINDINKLFDYRVIRYVLHGDCWIVNVEENAPTKVYDRNLIDLQLPLVQYRKNLIMLQSNYLFKSDRNSMTIINRYERFIPNPIGYYFNSIADTPAFLDAGHLVTSDNKTMEKYPLIIEDASGRQLWLNTNLEANAQMKFSIKELLESAGIKVKLPDEPENIIQWLTKCLSNIEVIS